jgi:hypothetical protein
MTSASSVNFPLLITLSAYKKTSAKRRNSKELI